MGLLDGMAARVEKDEAKVVEEEEEAEALKRELPAPANSFQFLEVCCRSSGKIRRFSSGTEAGFALNLINRKLASGVQQALYIEAVKKGEEPVSFGPNSVLVAYGQGWMLQTVLEEGTEEGRKMQSSLKHFPLPMKTGSVHSKGEIVRRPQLRISFIYLGKILLAFCFIFLLGGTCTLILENLPSLISLLASS